MARLYSGLSGEFCSDLKSLLLMPSMNKLGSKLGWLTKSCDTYFYNLSMKLGIHRMDDMLSQFGFGKPTGIDMNEELSGLLPSPEWKLATQHAHWYSGDTIISGIGQGFMLTTPLQLATGTAALASQGGF